MPSAPLFCVRLVVKGLLVLVRPTIGRDPLFGCCPSRRSRRPARPTEGLFLSVARRTGVLKKYAAFLHHLKYIYI